MLPKITLAGIIVLGLVAMGLVVTGFVLIQNLGSSEKAAPAELWNLADEEYSWTDEDGRATEWVTAPEDLAFNTDDFPYSSIVFGYGAGKGTLSWSDEGVLTFEGNADESALVLMDTFISFCTQKRYGAPQ